MTTNNTLWPPVRIALLHHTGGGNLGDDAIVESILHNIQRRWPAASITAISMNPEDSARRHGITSYPMRRHVWARGYQSEPAEGSGLRHRIRTSRNPLIRLPRAAVSELGFLAASRERIQAFDAIVLGGGGQLTDRNGPWSFPYAIFSWFSIAKSAGLKCIVLNTGAGPLINPLSKFFITRALAKADYVSFRDEESQALLRKIGYAGASHVFPDNVYALEIPKLSPDVAKKRDSRLVGIAPMPYPTDPPFDACNDKLIYEELVGKLAKFTSLLSRRSYPFSLFGTDIGSDPTAIQDLRTKLEADYKIPASCCKPVESLEDLLIRMSEFEYVVTCRFHGVVFAHLLNKPVLAISHHPKVTHLMNALGLSKYCVDIRTFDPQTLAEKFECLVQNTDEVKSQMASSLKKYQSRLKTQFDELWPRHVGDSVSALEVS